MLKHQDSLPRALRGARLVHGLTQRELGRRIGVSQSTISFWENGAEMPTVEHLILLALELPELLENMNGFERVMLQRIVRLERALFSGRCGCPGCSCQPVADSLPHS